MLVLKLYLLIILLYYANIDFIFFLLNLLGSVSSPMVPGSIRNIHEGQMGNAANHHSDRHGTEDYLNIVQRLSSEVQLHKTKDLF